MAVFWKSLNCNMFYEVTVYDVYIHVYVLVNIISVTSVGWILSVKIHVLW